MRSGYCKTMWNRSSWKKRTNILANPIHISLLFSNFFPCRFWQGWVDFFVLYGRSLLIFYSIYICVFMFIPTSLFILPPLPSLLFGNRKSVFSVCESVSLLESSFYLHCSNSDFEPLSIFFLFLNSLTPISLLKWASWKSALFWTPFWLPTPGNLLGSGIIYSPSGPVNIQGQEAGVLTL